MKNVNEMSAMEFINYACEVEEAKKVKVVNGKPVKDNNNNKKVNKNDSKKDRYIWITRLISVYNIPSNILVLEKEQIEVAVIKYTDREEFEDRVSKILGIY